jgi:predicted nicotinamide N-methyase
VFLHVNAFLLSPSIFCFLVAIYCGPKEVYLTDIHDPTLNNAAFNARLNAFKSPSEDEEGDVTVKMTSRADELFIEEVTIQSTDNAVLPMDIEHMTISSNSELEGHTHAHTPHSKPSVMSTLRVSKVSWSDPATFPPQSDVLIGSDLVYDSKILGLLTQAVNGMLKPGERYLFLFTRVIMLNSVSYNLVFQCVSIVLHVSPLGRRVAQFFK